MSQRQLQISGVDRKAEPETIVKWALDGSGQLVGFARAVADRTDVPADVRLRAAELVKRWAATNGGGRR